jgi:hypothetical protein
VFWCGFDRKIWQQPIFVAKARQDKPATRYWHTPLLRANTIVYLLHSLTNVTAGGSIFLEFSMLLIGRVFVPTRLVDLSSDQLL